jgi:hypothetical protein
LELSDYWNIDYLTVNDEKYRPAKQSYQISDSTLKLSDKWIFKKTIGWPALLAR